MDGNLCLRLVFSMRAEFGQATFLLLLLMGCAPAGWNGEVAVYVDGGRLISDAWLVERLEVKPQTLSAWRRKLKAAGLIDWTLKPGVGRVYVLGRMADPHPSEASPASSGATQAEEPERLASALVH